MTDRIIRCIKNPDSALQSYCGKYVFGQETYSDISEAERAEHHEDFCYRPCGACLKKARQDAVPKRVMQKALGEDSDV